MNEAIIHDKTIKFLKSLGDLSLEELSNIMKNALALEEIGQYEEAISWYDLEISKNPRDPLAWYNKGNVFDNIGKYKEAISCYDRVLDIIYDDTNSMYSKASILSKIGKYEEAISWYDKILSIDPTHVGALVKRKIDLEKIGMHYGVVPIKHKQML